MIFQSIIDNISDKEMLEELLKQQLIDIEGWLLLNYRQLNLDENQAILLMLVSRLEKMQFPYITPQVIQNYMALDEKQIDHYIVGLLSKKMMILDGNSLSVKPLKNIIFNQSNPNQNNNEKTPKVNLVSIFEHEFARALTPIEIETLKEWKQYHYSDQMIIDALKEATLSNVHNMRYIEKILIDWAKHGIKRSGRERVDEPQTKEVELVDYPWWEEEE